MYFLCNKTISTIVISNTKQEVKYNKLYKHTNKIYGQLTSKKQANSFTIKNACRHTINNKIQTRVNNQTLA